MKLKKEYTILVAVSVALVLYLVLRKSDRTHYRVPKVAKVAEAEISKIELSKLDTSIVLNKRDNSWYIAPQGYPANSRTVKDMLAIIGDLTLTTLVSESRNYSRYDLSDDTKITVRAWAGEVLRREFEVGKSAPSYRHTFVKLAGDDRVYHARDNFRGKFDQTVENLWDTTVLSFERAEIGEIQITKGPHSILLSRREVPPEVTAEEKSDEGGPPSPKSETLWETPDGKKGDESKLNRLLGTLSKLRCQKYMENRKKDDFTDPLCTLTLRGAQEYVLSLFAKTEKDAKNYPAISSQSDFPFLLTDAQADDIMKDPDEILEKPETS
jgi:hypothetical protein